MSSESATTLTVGARYACFACRARGVRAGRCERCGRARLELGTAAAQTEVLKIISTLAPRQHNPPGVARSLRWYRAGAHVFALGCAAAGVLLAAKIHTNGYAPRAAVQGALGGLGLIGGYVLAATSGALAFALAALFAVCASALALALGGLALLGLYARGARGARARAWIRAQRARALRAAFAPVRFVRRAPARTSDRGGVVRFLRAPDPALAAQHGVDGAPPASHAPTRDPGGETHVVDVIAPERPAAPQTGVLLDSGESASLGADLTGALVGAAGVTLGAELADARVAPLLLRAGDGRLTRVEVECGTVVLRGPGRAEYLGASGPAEWGLPPLVGDRWSRRRVPPGERVNVWVVAPGARVRIEGGLEREDMVHGPSSWGRSGEFGRVVRGTVDAPVCVRVLDDVAAD